MHGSTELVCVSPNVCREKSIFQRKTGLSYISALGQYALGVSLACEFLGSDQRHVRRALFGLNRMELDVAIEKPISSMSISFVRTRR